MALARGLGRCLGLQHDKKEFPMSTGATAGKGTRSRTPSEWIGETTVLLVGIAAVVVLLLFMKNDVDQENQRAAEALARQLEHQEKNSAIERIHSLQRQLAIGKPGELYQSTLVGPHGIIHLQGDIKPPGTPATELWERSLAELQAMEAGLKKDLERQRLDHKAAP
jgi:hypothetical protein